MAHFVPDWLKTRSVSHRDVIAIETESHQYTYQSLYQTVISVAGGLRVLGVSPGQRVALLLTQSQPYTLLLHALMQCSAVILPLNVRLTAAELEWQLRDAQVTHVIYDGASERQLVTAIQEMKLGHLQMMEFSRVYAIGQQAQPQIKTHIDLDEDLVILYTSGTTGRPKGVRISYGNVFASAQASAMQLGLDRHDKWLAPTPLFHMSGFSVVMRSVIYGTTAVLHAGFEAAAVNEAIEKDSITLISVVPVMLQRMLDEREGKPYPTSLRLVLLGGSAASEQLLAECMDKGVPVAQSYGLSETSSQVATLPVEDGIRKLGSSGLPLLPTEVIIRDNNGDVLTAGLPGEIAVRGPTVSPGYIGHATSTRQPGEWFATGDIGFFDDEGYLFVLDRRSDLIVSGGENVYPAEIESVIARYPGVFEVGVVGQPDATWGQVPIAVVRGNTSLVEQDVLEQCRRELARYKVPKRIIFTQDNLPRNASGKLLRRNLRQWL